MPERMDDADLPEQDYRRCLADLARVNRATLTHRATLHWLQERTRSLPPGTPFTVLDIASGYGDLLRAIGRWARERGYQARLIGVDLNPRAARAAREASLGESPAPEFVTTDVFAYVPDAPPDFIVTSQFTHHLPDAEIARLIRWMELNAARGWMVADLHRHWFPYYGFRWLARLAGWHPIVRLDGTISIARAFKLGEWPALLRAASLAPGPDLRVRWQFPFRIAVMRDKPVRA